MITEDYISFETAKLLKEKGFSCDEISCIKVFKGHTYKIQGNVIDADEDVTIPTIQMAKKWLIENYNIHIEVRYFPMPNIYRYVIIHSPTTIENIDSHPQYFNTYEEACESAIRYCLQNLI